MMRALKITTTASSYSELRYNEVQGPFVYFVISGVHQLQYNLVTNTVNMKIRLIRTLFQSPSKPFRTNEVLLYFTTFILQKNVSVYPWLTNSKTYKIQYIICLMYKRERSIIVTNKTKCMGC